MQKLFRLLVIAFGIKCAQSSGVISVEVTKMSNSGGQDYYGRCCDSISRLPYGRCGPDECDTYFRVCISTYSSKDKCLFGTARTPVLGGNSFDADPADPHVTMKIKFDKAWMIYYRLYLEALDEDVDGTDTLIENTTVLDFASPSSKWIYKSHVGVRVSIDYRIKIECDPNYYAVNCSIQCEPRDNYHGHYTCNESGERVCKDNWRGDYCTEPICATNCHPEHGYCTSGGECSCRPGWTGPNCDECVVADGCVHGVCTEAFECTCLAFWGGNNCEINLNACGDDPNPCQNASKCENKYGNFTCTCLPGFAGTRCEIAQHACAINDCENGSKCEPSSLTDVNYLCHCPPGFDGQFCEHDINECLNEPCENGSECVDKPNGFECICQPGWRGKTCEIDVDECKESNICVNAFGCINRTGTFMCKCKDGWTGKLCDKNINECTAGTPCENNGVCLDTEGSYVCDCALGYSGEHCEVNIDECALEPCINGGTCTDLINDYKCMCPTDFSGKNCEEEHSYCSDSRCENGGQCFNVNNDYECRCLPGYAGHNCQNIKDQCEEEDTECEVVDACRINIISSRFMGGERIENSNICGEHGDCIATSISEYKCACQPGFKGQFCELNVDDCEQSLCRNHGICIDGINSFRCECPPGYSGRTCETWHNPCRNSSCRNGALCRQTSLNDYYCSCKAGWYGKRCSLRSIDDICESKPCKSGKCIETSQGNGFECNCPADRKGLYCQHAKTLPCEKAMRCSGHGTCVNLAYDGSDDYKCHCKDGFTGKLCENSINHCSPNPCFNNGRCINGSNHYECECRPGFNGPECRNNIDNCYEEPCAKGSTCIDLDDDFRCKCLPGRMGRLCEILTDQPDQSSCSYKGDLFVHSHRWHDVCNQCTCHNGSTECTHINCGLKSCKKYNHECHPDEKCMSLDTSSNPNCVSATCDERLFCVYDAVQAKKMNQCDEVSANENISQVTLVFRVDAMSVAQGVHASDVCAALRYSSLTTYGSDKNISLYCCAKSIGNVLLTIESEDSHDIAKTIRQTCIDTQYTVPHPLDRIILNAIHDVIIIPDNDNTATIGIVLAVLLSILLILILILGTHTIRHKKRSCNANNESNYTLGSGSGCTDQLVMTSSPSAIDGMCDGMESDHFIYLSSRNKPHVYHNRRLSHIIRTSEPGNPNGPPPSYDESSRFYSAADEVNSIVRQAGRIKQQHMA